MLQHICLVPVLLFIQVISYSFNLCFRTHLVDIICLCVFSGLSRVRLLIWFTVPYGIRFSQMCCLEWRKFGEKHWMVTGMFLHRLCDLFILETLVLSLLLGWSFIKMSWWYHQSQRMFIRLYISLRTSLPDSIVKWSPEYSYWKYIYITISNWSISYITPTHSLYSPSWMDLI